LDWGGEFSNFGGAGWDVTTRNAGANNTSLFYLALNYNGIVESAVGTMSLPAATGDITFTGVGFKPQMALFGMGYIDAAETGSTDWRAGSLGFGGFSVGLLANVQRSDSIASEDNTIPSNTQCLSDAFAIRLPRDDGADETRATLSHVTSDGWAFNYGALPAPAVGAEFWYLAIGECPAVPGEFRVSVATHVQSTTLPMLVYKPLYAGGRFIDSLGFSIDALNPVWTAFGGYWSLTFTIRGSKSRIEEWIMDGLGRHIVLYNPGLSVIWSGFASLISANIGSLSIQRGPLLDTVANRLKVVYSFVDTSTDVPIVGGRASTGWYEDADSQSRYGVIERVLSVGGVSAGEEAQLAQVALEEYREPGGNEVDNLGSSVEPSATITCLGYIHWLKAYTYASTTTGLQNASTKLESVLAADPNSLMSTDYSGITTNTTQVKAYEQKDRTAWNVVKAIIAKGDASFNRYLFGLYDGRKAKYSAIPTNIAYQRSLANPRQELETYGAEQTVKPWDSIPGEWVFYTDFLIGRTQPGTGIRQDPRYLFIEQASFVAPWALTLNGAKISRLDQLMAQMGLGGTGA
jgi:hypothetical protein